MTEQDEFYVGMAKRLRELWLFLGYETAASFARAIGYPPDKYSRYERRGIVQTGVLIVLVKAIEASSQQRLNLYWLFGMRGPRAKEGPFLRIAN